MLGLCTWFNNLDFMYKEGTLFVLVIILMLLAFKNGTFLPNPRKNNAKED